jgi:hypothetical protein
MPKGVKGAYSSDYITRSVKHGAMNEANESSLHREGLDSTIMGANSGAFKQTQDSPSSKTNHRNAAGKIEGKLTQGEHG